VWILGVEGIRHGGRQVDPADALALVGRQELIDGIGVGGPDVKEQHVLHVASREQARHRAHITQLVHVRLHVAPAALGQGGDVVAIRAAREGRVPGPVVAVDGDLGDAIPVTGQIARTASRFSRVSPSKRYG
jgi:hypothetical protein